MSGNWFDAPQEPEEAVAATPALDAAAEQELARLRASSIQDIVLEFLGTRDQLDTERHAWQKLEADLKARLSMMSMVMREMGDKLGVDNFAIRGIGTAYRNTKTTYKVQNWAEFTKWLDETKNFQCLEKRVAKLATSEIERELGTVPPGIDKGSEVEFLVRRNKA